jgi:hypothetical protein
MDAMIRMLCTASIINQQSLNELSLMHVVKHGYKGNPNAYSCSRRPVDKLLFCNAESQTSIPNELITERLYRAGG